MVCRAHLFAVFFGVLPLVSAAPPPAADSGPSGPVSRRPPALYTDSLAPLLTPLKAVLARRGDFKQEGSDGMCLLDETILHTTAEGTRVIVIHQIEEAYTESGVDSLAEATHSYRTIDQRMHLVQARTILPDGRELPVEERAAFLESPQSDAADSVYGDRGQLRLIFSGIVPGAVRETIVVLEELAPRIPGHFSAQEFWSSFWPDRTTRTVMLMPDSVATRVKVTNLGSGVPAPVKEKWREGWHMWTWTQEKSPAVRYEGGRPPPEQVGPATMVTTLPDWDAFGDWYRQLLRERSGLDPALKKLAAEWTQDARTPREKLDAVITHVSRDLRYTGLEFGLGALQPRSAEEIWRTGYGDCKDKSNLAVLLLRELGIEADLVLLQTEHAGLVEKRCPDHRHFNHAILVATIDGERVFSDPTIRYGRPGMLSAPSSDRDVLIVKKDAVEWARTPPFPAAEIHYRMDAELDVDGNLEGWLDMVCTGYFQSHYQSYYERLGRQELRRDLQELLTALLPGSRLIDAQNSKAGADSIWRAYFSLPNQNNDTDENQTLHFPAGGPVILSTDDQETRETARFLWPVTWRVSGQIRLPAGWHAREIPAPFDLHTDAYEVRASWTVKGGVCQPAYEARVTRGLLQPAAHTAVWRGNRSLSAWLRKPLRLGRGSVAAPITAEAAALEKMPLMPTGEGQLQLVNQRYPDTGNRTLRRAALKKTLDYFPDDPATLFTARVHLALLDWDEDKPEEAIRALRDLTANPSAKVDEDLVWWARYMIAVIFNNTEKHAEAVKEFEAVIQRTSLSTYRRGWACFQISVALHRLKRDAEALRRVREGLALAEPESCTPLLSQCAILLFELNQQDEFKKDLANLVEDLGPNAAPALTRLAELAVAWAQDSQVSRTEAVVALLEGLPSETRAEETATALANAKKALTTAGAAGSLQKKLQEYLTAHPDLGILKAPAEGWPETAAACVQAYDKAEQAQDSDLASRLSMHLITAFPADPQFGARLWRTAAHLENHEREPSQKASSISPLLSFILQLGKGLPKSDDHYYELRFLAGRVLERYQQDWKSAAAVYDEIVGDKAMPESFLASALTRLANCYEALGDWPRTVATLSSLEAVKQYASAGDGLARAAHLKLEMGDPDEALRLLRIVEGSRTFALKNSAMPDTLRELLDLAKNDKAAKARWQATPAWWPLWKDLQTTLGIEDRGIEPLVVDLDAAGATIRQAVQDKDPAAAGRVLRQIAHAARWHPDRTITLAWLCAFQASRLHPEQHQALLAFVQALCDPFDPFTDDQRRSRLMYLTVSHMDRDAAAAAVRHVHQYFEAYPQDEHALTFVMARLWGSLAMQLKDERPKAAAALSRTLTSKELRDERINSVRSLADLYRASADAEKEIALLKANLDHPAITAEPQNVAFLKQRLEQLTVGSGYSRAVRRWIAKNAPPWYDYAKPKDLKELNAGEDLYAAIQDTFGQRQLAENIKVYLLAAAAGAAPSDQIDEWWARAFSSLLMTRPQERSALRAAVDQLLEDPEAPPAFKDTTLRMAYLYAATFGEGELLKHWRPKLPPAQLSTFTRDRMDIADTVLALDLSDSQAVAEAIRAQVKKRNVDLLEFLAARLAERAVQYGRLEALQAISDALAQARKEAVIDPAAVQALRLEIVRALSTARRLLPVQNALAEVVLKHPAAQPADGAQVPQFIGRVSSQMMTARQFMDWMHAQFRAGKRPCDDLRSWYGYLNCCADAGAAKTWELRRQWVDAALAATADDETRAEVVNLAASAVDADSPMERDYLLNALKPWRNAAEFPRTHASLRLMDAHFAERLGQPFDLQSLAALEEDDVKAALPRLRLSAALISGNRTAVNAALDKLGSEAMLESGNMIQITRALKLAGRTDELELALETAEEDLYHAVLNSWTGAGYQDAMEAIHLAEILNKPAALPEAWIKFIHQAYPERHDQLVAAMLIARLKKDWPAALAAASEAVEKFPTFYSNYWVKGEALWELGRKREALEPLRIYVKYCNDETHHRRAAQLLKEAAPQ